MKGSCWVNCDVGVGVGDGSGLIGGLSDSDLSICILRVYMCGVCIP